ncbi:MAG: hypothetical protein KME60_31180 [Cyanomargarita calcarea GSE-NOS-MK-12-04C]|jgi:hypothetical protein|uniref:Uncharacterized protein n=1 Tax=Cyanomargarita calcarea GSE-NOS-MK-12-04C TaxID=2839659 RepID=A0A951QWA2_9CYAN|nr:hypothetical protein [Cyanomargarita calcarea GSE-NOS-MK-12-04C]
MNSEFYSGSNCENLGETIVITALLTKKGRELSQQDLKKLSDKCIRYYTNSKLSKLEIKLLKFFWGGNLSPLFCTSLEQKVLKTYFPGNSKDTIDSFNQAAKLFGSPIFQYGIATQFDNYRNILVWFFFDEETESLFNYSGFKHKLSELFLIRHLIVQDFQAASEPSSKNKKDSIYQLADAAYAEIKRLINEELNVKHGNSTRLSEEELQNFNKAIINIIHKEFEYSENLGKIEKKLEQIVKNTRKYNEKLINIASVFPDKNNSLPTENENIKFLVMFSEKKCLYFKEQIEADLSYLRDGSRLIEKAISVFRTQIQIDQAERDRSLQNTILILTYSSIGMAAAGISASSYNYHPLGSNIEKGANSNQNSPVLPYPPAPLYISSIYYSLIVGLFFGVAAWLIFKKLPSVLPGIIKCAGKLTSICGKKKPANEAANAGQENRP